jgi:hypothetical protein
VQGEEEQRLFKLASFFPEAVPIPLWLLGLAAGLGESIDIVDPLGEAYVQLRDLSLLEALSGDRVRLHPLVRDFGQRLVTEDGYKGQTLLRDALERLIVEFTDLNKLEERILAVGYHDCLEQVRFALAFAELLEADRAEPLRRIERWLNRESYVLGDGQWWPRIIPGLFYQQLYNRSIEENYPLAERELPARWLRQVGGVGAESHSLLRVLAGHTDTVTSVAFSPDGTKILTGSMDQTARLWETASGKQLSTLEGHIDPIWKVAFSPDGSRILIGSRDQTARLWETASGRLLATLEGHTGPMGV